jgi:hypothetical protein
LDIYIDPEIEELVVFMNKMGFRTYASCQGHGIPVHRVKPYIAFRAEIDKVKQLEKILRIDSESPSPILNWGWSIIGNFDCDFELVFRLAPENPRIFLLRYRRGALREDFSNIIKLLASCS